MLQFERDEERFAASFVAIYPCIGAGDPAADARLRAAIATGGALEVTRFVQRRATANDARWLAGEDWFLA